VCDAVRERVRLLVRLGVPLLGSVLIYALVVATLAASNGNVSDGKQTAYDPEWFSPVEWLWFAVWDAIGVHEFRLVMYFHEEYLGDFLPGLPEPLWGIHVLLMDLTHTVPAFVLALIAYRALAARVMAPRCSLCGARLANLSSAHCSGCGSPL